MPVAPRAKTLHGWWLTCSKEARTFPGFLFLVDETKRYNKEYLQTNNKQYTVFTQTVSRTQNNDY